MNVFISMVKSQAFAAPDHPPGAVLAQGAGSVGKPAVWAKDAASFGDQQLSFILTLGQTKTKIDVEATSCRLLLSAKSFPPNTIHGVSWGCTHILVQNQGSAKGISWGCFFLWQSHGDKRINHPIFYTIAIAMAITIPPTKAQPVLLLRWVPPRDFP